ncbi:MAG TPA: hypothetical protein VM406_14355 [Noviherbaspirillum sp.]|nr:hypothetical protein [Noviherbaspirillum sp.]
MPAGASPKREREYKKLEKRFKQEHRYPGREEEVASRIVNKQRSQYGETRTEKQKDKQGRSPDRGLPIEGYQQMTIAQISKEMEKLSAADIRKLRSYEVKHKNRKGMLERMDRMLQRH